MCKVNHRNWLINGLVKQFIKMFYKKLFRKFSPVAKNSLKYSALIQLYAVAAELTLFGFFLDHSY